MNKIPNTVNKIAIHPKRHPGLCEIKAHKMRCLLSGMTVIRILWASGFFLAFNATAAATMLIRNFQELRHSRFYAGADKDFIGDPYDLSGVGRTAYNSGTWATLVSDNYFISATHYHPVAGNSVTFWTSNSIADPSYSYTVAGGQRIGGTDLWVGWFNSAVNSSIERYPVLGLSGPAEYLGLVQHNYGINHRLGLNVTEDYGTATVGSSTGFVWAADYNNNDTPSVGGDETFLQGGDSGAPTFNVVSGQLALIGIHWAISDDIPGTNEGEWFMDSAVPAYITEINGVLANRGQELMVVPEPSGTLLLCCILVMGAATTRRRL
jgi:hypothetical protein